MVRGPKQRDSEQRGNILVKHSLHVSSCARNDILSGEIFDITNVI